MFAMLSGDLPTPPRGAARDELDAVLALQSEAGIDLVTDAGVLRDADPVTRWKRTSERTDRLVCGIVVGPWTLASAPMAAGPAAPPAPARPAASPTVDPAAASPTVAPGAGGIPDRLRLERSADATRAAIEALVEAGCRLIRVDEPALVTPGLGAEPDRDERATTELRAMAHDAHERALPELGDAHAMLALTGGDASPVGASTLAAMRYSSYLFDLLRGPDSWRVIAELPTERGVVCGVVPTDGRTEVVKEAMVWAAQYAASTRARGLQRVGLATAGDLGGLEWSVAAARVRLLGEAARIAADDSMAHLARELDPRAIGMKSAAFGRNLPIPERPGGRATGGQGQPDAPDAGRGPSADWPPGPGPTRDDP
jgi:hypothetical protein